jgi:hypothetical protein
LLATAGAALAVVDGRLGSAVAAALVDAADAAAVGNVDGDGVACAAGAAAAGAAAAGDTADLVSAVPEHPLAEHDA